MVKLIFTFFITFLSVSSAFTQQINEAGSKKIAFVNELAFDSNKNGIIKLTHALDQMEMFDCFPLPCTQEQREIKRKTVVEPVLNEILEELKQAEVQNNIVILQADKLDLNDRLLAIDMKFDVTEKFINFFNDKSNKSFETLILTIPASKIAVIDTNVFFDKIKGIKQIVKVSTEKISVSKSFCSKTVFCQEITDFLQLYAIKKGYSVVFDSRKDLPEEIRNFKKDDLTQEFISEYNKNNP